MGFDVSGFQKSKEIYETGGPKLVPTKVCKIEAKVERNVTQRATTNRRNSKEYQKNEIHKSKRKKCQRDRPKAV